MESFFKKKHTRIPLPNLTRTVKTSAKPASSFAPIWPINAWLITWIPQVEHLVDMAGAATTHIFLLSFHTLFTSDNSTSSSSSSDDDADADADADGFSVLSNFCLGSPSIFHCFGLWGCLRDYATCWNLVMVKKCIYSREGGVGLGHIMLPCIV